MLFTSSVVFSRRTILLTLILLLSLSKIQAQERIFYCGYSDRDMGERLCNFTQQSAFSSNSDAEEAVDKILAPLGLPRNFVLVSCPRIDNAIAITPDDGLRYIIYDNAFISRLDGGNVDWKALSILAHELGHHLCGHTLRSSQSLEEQRKKELEADEFSGFIMEKLGASLAQAQLAVNEIASEGDDSYSTHPNKEKRLKSIEKGYVKAGGKAELTTVDDDPGAESFFYDGNVKYTLGDLTGSLAAYNQAIVLNPKFAQAYYNRGQVKRALGDLQGAIVDFSQAIALKPGFPEAYNYRGQLQCKIGNYQGALADLNVAISSLTKPDPLAFFNRGIAKKNLSDFQGAYSDLTNAIMIEEKAEFYLDRGIVRSLLGDLVGAMQDYTDALSRDSSLVLAYYNRGTAKLSTEDYEGAIADFEAWLVNNPDDHEAMLNIGLAYINMQNYQEAEAAFTNLITKKPEYAEAYYYRGLSRKYLVAYEGALADYSQAITLGMHTAEIYYSRGGLYYEIRSLDAAISDLDQAIAMRLNYASAYYLRGLVNQLRGDEAAACSDYTNGCANGSQAACMEKNNLCQ